MAIWTSRYSNQILQNGKYYAVGISLGKPKFHVDYQIMNQLYELAPGGYTLRWDYERFKRAYFEKLNNLGRRKVENRLLVESSIAHDTGKELVLLCFEDIRKPEEWCHRTLLAEWCRDNLGITINELEDPNPPKLKKSQIVQQPVDDGYEQLSLFSGSPARGMGYRPY